jgi:Lamin Tail Domain
MRRYAFAAAACLFLNHGRQTFVSSASNIIISEIAGKGSSNVCGDDNNDWIELYNNDPSENVSLAGYILHDDKGINDTKAFTFPPDYDDDPIPPGKYRLICTMGDNATLSPQFSIGGMM